MKNARPQTSEASAAQPHFNGQASLFPEEPQVLAASWPTAGTQADKALHALLLRPTITQAEYRHSWRLAAYVNALKNAGWAICKRMITPPGWHASIAEYSLNKSAPAVVAALRQRGRA